MVKSNLVVQKKEELTDTLSLKFTLYQLQLAKLRSAKLVYLKYYKNARQNNLVVQKQYFNLRQQLKPQLSYQHLQNLFQLLIKKFMYNSVSEPDLSEHNQQLVQLQNDTNELQTQFQTIQKLSQNIHIVKRNLLLKQQQKKQTEKIDTQLFEQQVQNFYNSLQSFFESVVSESNWQESIQRAITQKSAFLSKFGSEVAENEVKFAKNIFNEQQRDLLLQKRELMNLEAENQILQFINEVDNEAEVVKYQKIDVSKEEIEAMRKIDFKDIVKKSGFKFCEICLCKRFKKKFALKVLKEVKGKQFDQVVIKFLMGVAHE